MSLPQDLSRFAVPRGFRGRNAIVVQLWWIVQATLFRWSPQIAYGFRRMLLRVFGAKIGRQVLVRQTAVITYPWKVQISDFAWIGDDVHIYSLGDISIGAHSVVSQGTYLCGGDHDYRYIDFPIRGAGVKVGAGVWIAAETFVAPGVVIGDGTVVGARSLVISDMPAYMICAGSPAKPIKERESFNNQAEAG